MSKSTKKRKARLSRLEKLMHLPCGECGEKPSIEMYKGKPICYYCLNPQLPKQRAEDFTGLTSNAGGLEDNAIFKSGEVKEIYDKVNKNGLGKPVTLY